MRERSVRERSVRERSVRERSVRERSVRERSVRRLGRGWRHTRARPCSPPEVAARTIRMPRMSTCCSPSGRWPARRAPRSSRCHGTCQRRTSCGWPTTALVTIRKHVLGKFNILAGAQGTGIARLSAAAGIKCCSVKDYAALHMLNDDGLKFAHIGVGCIE